MAPAGGCVVFVMSIAIIATALDKDAASQRRLSKRDSEGMRLKSFVMQTPTRALMKCPPIKARGWASGTSMAP